MGILGVLLLLLDIKKKTCRGMNSGVPTCYQETNLPKMDTKTHALMGLHILQNYSLHFFLVAIPISKLQRHVMIHQPSLQPEAHSIPIVTCCILLIYPLLPSGDYEIFPWHLTPQVELGILGPHADFFSRSLWGADWVCSVEISNPKIP